MSGIFGKLGLADTDRSFVNVIGQRAVYDAVQQVLGDHNADLAVAMSVFVEQTTSDFKLRYKLPGGGRLQRRGGEAQSAAVKAYGSWDVAFPLEDFGATLAGDDITLAYMNMQELNRHLDTIMIQDRNTVRHEILKALLNNTQDTFIDRIHGSLSIEPLANGDAVIYPPVLGSETGATEDHYLISGYAASAISDTNNPYATIEAELSEHFGMPSGGANIISFINSAQRAKTEDLTDFVEVPDRWIRPGADTAVPSSLPAAVPGQIIGRVSGCWVSVWQWVPANYIIALHLDAPKPLIQRVDPADTGLPQGLTLVARDNEYPLQSSFYRHRFGLGVGNRLNGVIMELGTGGAYSIPSGYS